jgi:N,N'-diacetyllegionaminate synthase
MKNKVLIIAEAGVNHNGSLDLAKKLVSVAAAAGADYVKFQTFKADNMVDKNAPKASYQIQNTAGDSDSQYEMLKKLEMPADWHHELQFFAIKEGIGFLSTGFDEESIDLLDTVRIPFFKIPSGEITNKPYLQHVATKGKPVIVSTGMASMNEIGAALDVLESAGIHRSMIKVLHCNTEYPTPMKDVNLLAMTAIQKQFGVDVGYSDHTLGIEVSVAAVALGARVIEKHFTLDRKMDGPDHAASLEPDELRDMVRSIRNIELAISGDGIKKPSDSEQKNINIARKSIYLKIDLPKDSMIRMQDVIMKRPGDGISPMEIEKVVGRRTATDLKANTKIKESDLV